MGHSECDAILVGNGKVNAAPALFAGDIDASLIHEAAIGKIAGEQLIKLQTLGLTSEGGGGKRFIEGFCVVRITKYTILTNSVFSYEIIRKKWSS